jgi:hypothetical protein
VRFPLAIVAALTAAALPLAALGCGGGGTSKRDFAKKANAICSDVEKRFREIRQQRVKTPSEGKRRISRVEAAMKDAVVRLRGLDRPDGDAGRAAQQFVNVFDQKVNGELVPALRDERNAIDDRDRQAAQAAVRRLQGIDLSRVNTLASKIGANACAG